MSAGDTAPVLAFGCGWRFQIELVTGRSRASEAVWAPYVDGLKRSVPFFGRPERCGCVEE